ncbi:hypothetical protein AVP_38 [Aerococcus phage vB_AviM_AVP]|nr:hypothetical protein AVP_38 [Aerococcus phage vB_AviM_AVP]
MLRTITIDTEKIAKSMVESTVRHLALSKEDTQEIIKDIKVDLDELPDSDYEYIINKEFTERGNKLGSDLAMVELLLNDDLDYF